MIRTAAARYREFLRHPDVPRMIVMEFLARMPVGTLVLSMLLYVRSLYGSFAIAGATVGAYLAASATTAPIVGRIIDRRGPRTVLLVTGIVGPAGLAAILLAGPLGLPQGAVLALAVLAGAFSPPVAVLTRTMWRYRFDEERDRQTAFAIDGVLIELTFTLGPLLVAALLAAASPLAAFAMSWIFAVSAVPLFLASPALRYWKHEPGAERHLLGPLTEPRLLLLYLATFLLTFCFGLNEVGYPAYATALGTPALSGLLLAANSFGSACGGLAYGGLHIRGRQERLLPGLLLLMALPLALQGTVAPIGALLLLAFVAGVLIAPTFAVVTMTVTNYAPPRYATEAFTWSSTCIVSGLGAGSAVGGRVVESFGATPAFFAAGGFAAAAGLVTLGLRRARRTTS